MDIGPVVSSIQWILDAFRESNASFIPASPTDEPPVETEPPDPDRARDDANFKDSNICVTYEPIDRFRPVMSIPVGSPLTRREEHVFRYFLDGSLRTYYWGDISVGTVSYPVLASEIAVCVLKRDEDGFLHPRAVSHQIIAIFPLTRGVIRDALENRPLDAVKPIFLESEPSPERELRFVLAAKARERLHALEVETANNITGRENGEWLIVDGDIRHSSFLALKDTVGLAKSFSWKPVIEVEGSHLRFNLPRVIYGLKEGERTPVLRKKSDEYPSLAFWYLRFWSPDKLDNYMQGVVKVEVVMEGGWDERKRKLADKLSRALLAERLPAIYPVRRWHSHIYSIYQAETRVKSSLYSPQVLRQILFSAIQRKGGLI